MESIALWFRLSEVGVIAEHAAAATQHSPSITQYYNEEPGVASLVWVKDDGTYLMSNGIPRQLADPDQPESRSLVAYAQGWGPGTGPAIGDTPVGGDDFAEHVELAEPVSGGGTLLDLIRHHGRAGGWMIITANPQKYEISFAPAGSL
ncbi:DUF3085 domain-containing protein [Nocardia miyunensis]|uniref:DUF3085 domain-containing protein n=1 Tax=Nocardia miyunensis TaxID=282684 RepID=UPI00082E116E|nr:DUF3085 domain-containing protein [Nocardia miyunensis]